MMEPMFDTLRINVTVKEKTTAVLPCPVESLGKYEVVWTDMFATLLTHKDRRIIDDERISIERPYPYDWNLHIRDVRYSDQGEYNCQINTHPVKIKTINLIVQDPLTSTSTRSCLHESNLARGPHLRRCHVSTNFSGQLVPKGAELLEKVFSAQVASKIREEHGVKPLTVMKPSISRL
ncbi:cell adhesion molecule 2 [Plakobranchus ocellatus]|uniref:Cell adhesion molecule 2 n=1 Tax=Plakobranchus ocellatus TaxID=259542 RepID=A0AAV4BZQ9_9GAST|nr:cell adhesion molecule 2 [Plakobranchus ocellatus]